MSDFHLVLEDHVPPLMRYAAALTRDPEQAAALVEDTVLEALAQQGDRRRREDVRVRLLTILHEQRDNPFRRAVPAAFDPRHEGEAAATPALSRFDRALGRLPEAQRAVILLIGLENMSYNQTAAILGISVGAMRSRLALGRDSLRRSMGMAPDPRSLARAA